MAVGNNLVKPKKNEAKWIMTYEVAEAKVELTP